MAEAPDTSRVREIAMQRAASFVDEIRSSLEFYTAQAQGARIARVLVTGGGSKLEGFLELLRQRIPVEVEAGQVFQHARSQLSLSDEALAEAGAGARRGRRARDPREGSREPGQPASPDVLQTLRVSAAHLWRGRRGHRPGRGRLRFYLLQSGELSSVNDEIVEVRRPRTPRSRRDRREAAVRRPAGRGAGAAAAAGRGLRGEVSFSALLMDVSRVIPSDAYLDNLAVQADQGQTPPTGRPDPGLIGAITASGQAVSIDTLSDFLTRLEQVKGWVNPWMPTVARNERPTGTTIR